MKAKGNRFWLFGLIYFVLTVVFRWKEITRWGWPQAWFDLVLALVEALVATAMFAGLMHLTRRFRNHKHNDC